MQHELALDRPGPASGLTPHASVMQRAHARADPAFSTTLGNFQRLPTPDSCLTECMLQDTACVPESIRAYRIEFADIFSGTRPRAYTSFIESIRRPARSIRLARSGFRARRDHPGVLAVSDGGRLAPSSGIHRAASRSRCRLPKRSKSRSSVSSADTPQSRQSAAIWASKTRLPAAPASRTASRSRSG